MQLLWAAPFLGGFIAFVIAGLLKSGEAAAGIMIMLGILTGSIIMLTYVLGSRYIGSEEKENDHNHKD
jgi:hypothetical protein